MIQNKGKVGEQALSDFAAGYTDENALDVVLGVSLATLCNYANNLINTPHQSRITTLCSGKLGNQTFLTETEKLI